MFKVLKPFAAPVIAFLVGLAMNFSPVENHWLSGLLIGIAMAWGLAVCLSHKALLRRVPWLVEWVPFLDQNGTFATAERLTGSYVSGQQFRVALIAENSQIFGRTFDDCVIFGPAVLVFSEFATMNDCKFVLPSPENTMHWIFPFEKNKTSLSELPIGGIVVTKCTFNRCAFVGIGFVGNPESVAEFRSTIRQDSG